MRVDCCGKFLGYFQIFSPVLAWENQIGIDWNGFAQYLQVKVFRLQVRETFYEYSLVENWIHSWDQKKNWGSRNSGKAGELGAGGSNQLGLTGKDTRYELCWCGIAVFWFPSTWVKEELSNHLGSSVHLLGKGTQGAWNGLPRRGEIGVSP